MKSCLLPASVLALSLALPVSAQIATSNEKGATGAYSEDIGSSFTSEGRFGPKTALDDLRADVDRDREAREKLRLRVLQEAELADAEQGDDAETTDASEVEAEQGVPDREVPVAQEQN